VRVHGSTTIFPYHLLAPFPIEINVAHADSRLLVIHCYKSHINVLHRQPRALSFLEQEVGRIFPPLATRGAGIVNHYDTFPGDSLRLRPLEQNYSDFDDRRHACYRHRKASRGHPNSDVVRKSDGRVVVVPSSLVAVLGLDLELMMTRSSLFPPRFLCKVCAWALSSCDQSDCSSFPIDDKILGTAQSIDRS
jgi:hypothetical protein